jgi:Cys-rich repeat protein
MSHNTGFQRWALLAGVGAACCLLLSFAWAADQGAGTAAYSWQKEVLARVEAVQRDTKVQRAGEAKFKRIGVKAPLYIMDFVSTGKSSKLWWKGTFNAYSTSDKWKPGPDVTHGSLGADSVFGFKQFTRAGASYRFVGYVQKGTVRFIKTLPNTDPPSKFTIGTQTAWIEVLYSDRAADFIVESKNASVTTVTVLWGKIRVRNISPETKESRVLTSCQEVDVERDQEPGDIKWVSTDTMKELVKRTTIPRTLPEDVPSCERLKTEVLLDRSAVFLPPPGVALFPVPVFVPVPPGKKECCPPGQMYDSRTGKCRCPCPEGELPPVAVLGNNGSVADGLARPCGSCRNGAKFNPDTCSCECPCPQGFLLPGQGCVPQCPEGYSAVYDASSSPPYRCRYCVQTGVGNEPLPPPLRQCQNGEQCDRCEACVLGTCVPKACDFGLYLDQQSCECLPVKNGKPIACSDNAQCPSSCWKCVHGQCIPRITSCPEQQRLNPSTCQCEPEAGDGEGVLTTECHSDSDCGEYGHCHDGRCSRTIPKPERPEVPEIQHSIGTGTPVSEALPECQANSDCGNGQICKKGKCVKKPPRKRIPKPTSSGEEDVELPNLLEEPGEGIPSGGGIGIGGGIGVGGQSGGVQRVPQQGIVPKIPSKPQRIRRGVGPN